MKDETYAFVEDVREKAVTRRSARNKRTHCGKGGRVRMPSDYLTKKELLKMSGECTSYRLNEPMTWKEFMVMPDDIKVTYINLIRQKWNVPVSRIGEMMGVGQTTIQRETTRLGMTFGKGANKVHWDKDGFYAWVNGVKAADEPVVEEVVEEPVEIPVEEPVEEVVWRKVEESNDPFVNPIAIPEHKPVPQTSVPERGELVFKCPASLALDTVKSLLENVDVEIRIAWRVNDGSGC